MISDARRAANNKWDAANMCNLSCKVRREDAERYKASAARQGLTINSVLKRALDDMLSNDNVPTDAQ